VERFKGTLEMGLPGGGGVETREVRQLKDVGGSPVSDPRQRGGAWGGGGVCKVLETFKEGGGRDATGEGEKEYGKEYKRRRRGGHGTGPWLPKSRKHTCKAKTVQRSL
jgi:hypothetical protein